MHVGVIGARHDHVIMQVRQLLDAGATLGPIHEPDESSFAAFQSAFPDVPRVDSAEQILDDDSIQLITGAGIASERAPMGVAALRAGKDVIVDKPGVLDRANVAAVQQAMDDSGRRFTIWFHERLSSRAANRAVEIAQSGRIGDIVGCSVLAPHRLRASGRPDWFWDQSKAGDILIDLASHHLELFLELVGDRPLSIDWAQQDNVAMPERTNFSDVATVVASAPNFTGTIRVDWHSPESLGTWGDGRVFIQGTTGYVEVRRAIDIAGDPGVNHVLWVDDDGIHREQLDEAELSFAAAYLNDLGNGTDNAIPIDRWRRTSELALDASEMSRARGASS